MNVTEPDMQARWRPEDWNPSEGDIGTAIHTVKYAIEKICGGRRDFAIRSLQSTRGQMSDGTLAGIAVLFGAMLLSHPPGVNERLWRLRREIETWQLTEQQKSIYAEAVALMSAFADRDVVRRDLLCGSSDIPPLRICIAVISIAAVMLSDQDGEEWLEDWEWTLIRLWGPGPFNNNGGGQR